MTWARVDDGVMDHAKARALEAKGARMWADGLAVWLALVVYSARNLTDGVISLERLMRLTPLSARRVKQVLPVLVEVGLLEPAGRDVQVHDYLHYNPSREAVLARRAASAERTAQSRRRRSGKAPPVQTVLQTGSQTDTQTAKRNVTKSGEYGKCNTVTDAAPDPQKIEERKAAASKHTDFLQAPPAAATPAWVDDAPHTAESLAPPGHATPRAAAEEKAQGQNLKPAQRVTRTPAPGARNAPLASVAGLVQGALAGDPRALVRAARSAQATEAPKPRGRGPASGLEVRAAVEDIWPGRMSEAQAQQVVEGGWSWDEIELVLAELRKRRGACSPSLLLIKLRDDLPALKKQRSGGEPSAFGGAEYAALVAMRDGIGALVDEVHDASQAPNQVVGRIAATGVSPEVAVAVYAQRYSADEHTTWADVATALEAGERAPAGLAPPRVNTRVVEEARAAAARMFAMAG